MLDDVEHRDEIDRFFWEAIRFLDALAENQVAGFGEGTNNVFVQLQAVEAAPRQPLFFEYFQIPAVSAAYIQIRYGWLIELRENLFHAPLVEELLPLQGYGAHLFVVVGIVGRRVDETQGFDCRPRVKPDVVALSAANEPPGVDAGP